MNFEEFLPDDVDVQKAVVEALAADKVEQNEQLESIHRENEQLKSEISRLKENMAEMAAALANVGDVLAKNAEGETSSKIALIDRNIELEDRFLGETRDQVLEVIKEARDAAEMDGRIRRAQLLESVLAVNEPVGNLAKKRASLTKFFNDNGNILSGLVIAELERSRISHKKGEEFLLTTEILKRTY